VGTTGTVLANGSYYGPYVTLVTTSSMPSSGGASAFGYGGSTLGNGVTYGGGGSGGQGGTGGGTGAAGIVIVEW
jgi:hypothetical protein